jgi:cbb3-type cytochrome oxidase subunit 1
LRRVGCWCWPGSANLLSGLSSLLVIVQFLPPFFARGLEDLYVSSWYIIGGLIFTLLAYPMGNVVPELLPGARGAAFSGLWIHDAIGLFVTPLALAILYFVIPASTRRPIFSHFLSMLGFWLLFFLYPLNGTHHYIFSVIPMSAQTSAITASTLLGVDVILVVANLLLSLRGAGLFPRDIALRFVSRLVTAHSKRGVPVCEAGLFHTQYGAGDGALRFDRSDLHGRDARVRPGFFAVRARSAAVRVS